MFYFSKILTSLLLPPGLFLLLGASLAFLLKKMTKRGRRAVLAGSLLLLYGLSIRPVANGLIKPLEEAFPRPDSLSSDPAYIVILGGGVVDRADGSSLSPDAAVRLTEGYLLHKETGLPVIFAGGKVLKKEVWPSEAEVAEETLLRLGMSPGAIHTETESRNTLENAANIQEKYDPPVVWLVTSAYHMKRSVGVFRRQGIPVLPYPVDYKREEREYRFLDFLPSMSFLMTTYHALHEYLGIVYYSLRSFL